MADFVDEIERCPHGIDYNYDCDACIDEALRENHEAGGHADEARDFCPLCIRDALVPEGFALEPVLGVLVRRCHEYWVVVSGPDGSGLPGEEWKLSVHTDLEQPGVWYCHREQLPKRLDAVNAALAIASFVDARVGAPASEVLPALAHVAAEAAEDAEQQQLECLGHESVSGPAGVTVYCDGSCRAKEAR